MINRLMKIIAIKCSSMHCVPVLYRLLLSCVSSHTGKNYRRCCTARRDVSNTIVSWPTFAQRHWAATLRRTRASMHHVPCSSCPSHRCHLAAMLSFTLLPKPHYRTDVVCRLWVRFTKKSYDMSQDHRKISHKSVVSSPLVLLHDLSYSYCKFITVITLSYVKCYRKIFCKWGRMCINHVITSLYFSAFMNRKAGCCWERRLYCVHLQSWKL